MNGDALEIGVVDLVEIVAPRAPASRAVKTSSRGRQTRSRRARTAKWRYRTSRPSGKTAGRTG
eukprot:1690963-Pleurochrysis_carterae.AAC.2